MRPARVVGGRSRRRRIHPSLALPVSLDVGTDNPAPQLREVSRQIAIQVVRTARGQGIGRAWRDDQIEAAVRAATWFPDYATYLPG